jgi:replicative DNA helicase
MAKDKLRIPPHHTESEQAVLGSIMLRPEAMHEVSDTLSPDSFYSDKHRIIYGAMLKLNAKNEPIDLLSLATKLEDSKHLDSIGGRSYLAELTERVPASTNIKHYAQIVYKKHLLRSLINASEQISEIGFKEGDDEVEDLLDQAEQKIFSITGAPKGHKFTSIKQTIKEVWEQLEKLQEHKDGIRGVPTGYRALDDMLSGLQKSDLIILAARPSIGKTAFALNIARQAAILHEVPVAIFSLEMSAGQLTQRMLSAQSRVNAWHLQTGRIHREEDFEHLRDALDQLSRAPIYIDDMAGNSITKMKAVARRLKSEHGLGLIIVDYLQLMTTNKNYDSMVNQVTEISRSLKGLARELNVPVMALSQLSRAVESRGGKPRLSDLRDSGSIEQDADVVMFLHREDRMGNRSEEENTGIVEVLIEKHRNGPVGHVELFFDEKTGVFLPIEKNDIGRQDMSRQSLEDF